ncbi:hypothetical protein NM208_g656 [Fusarium decemcellulare]|uniref:Uncharacterized protein n=1 Tax=Fusarium decemcellulare TaxID=57161 RepID=A0ACC1SZ34_9HYPO|nr:hypothetical protein NM208_g656 [Fusarium decemcellulare]
MRLQTVLAFTRAVDTSTVLQLNGTTYFSPGLAVSSVDIGGSSVREVLPATYLNQAPASVNDLDKQFDQLLDSDDVISASFLSTVIFPEDIQISDEIKDHLKSTGTEIFVLTPGETLPSGPYILQPSGALTKVYRLYVDYNMAFTQGVFEGQDGEYLPSIATAAESVNAAISIPVPSRHYYPKPSPERPLSGVRLAVKDIYHLKGIKTSAGSRAYFDLYPPATETAASLQRLIDLGAVVVGKVKTTQFANGEAPTAGFVDQLAPWNPRGDGYQAPGASSCGTGSALATYDWLDLGTATDTGGSVRMPAKANGVFGLRITNASLSLDGIVPITPKMDTPGLIARDAKLLQTAYTNWFKAQSTYTSFPKRIILPDEFWPTANQTSMPIFERFIEKLSEILGAEVENVNTNASFIEYTGNRGGLSAGVNRFLDILSWDQWQGMGKLFTSEYQAQFDRWPSLNPMTRFAFAMAQELDRESYNQAVRQLEVYKEWFTSKIVTACEDSLVVYPIGPGDEEYRDDSLRSGLPGASGAYPHIIQASGSGLPDYTVPIGTRKYRSKISLREEELPVSVGIIGGAGCDHMLLDLIVKLGEEMNGFKTTVKTGRTLW